MDTGLLEQEHVHEMLRLTEELRSLLKDWQRERKDSSKRGLCQYLGVTPSGHIYRKYDCTALMPDTEE